MKFFFSKLSGLCLLAILAFSCKNGTNQTQKEFSFQSKKYEKKLGACPNETEQCLTVKLSYPLVEGGVDSVRQKLNNFINRANLSLLTFGENEPDLSLKVDSAVLELGEEYFDFLDDTDFAQAWFLESEGAVTYLDTSYISLDFSQTTYTGGAHPNSYLQKSVFDIKTGMQLELADLVKDTANLRKAVEIEFRKVREIPEGESLEEAGFWFEYDNFLLAHNFGLTDNGLEFFYNPYEVAPYAAGSTSVLIVDWKKFQ